MIMSGRLYRSRTDKFLGGVCGGLGKYIGIDPTIVRIVFLILLFETGIGFLLYILLWILLPVEGAPAPGTENVSDRLAEGVRGVGDDIRQAAQRPNPQAGLWFGIGLIVLGAVLFLQQMGNVLGIAWINTWLQLGTLWPLLIIAIGVAIILRGSQKGE
jgi:phage shock protein C